MNRTLSCDPNLGYALNYIYSGAFHALCQIDQITMPYLIKIFESDQSFTPSVSFDRVKRKAFYLLLQCTLQHFINF